MSPFSIARDDRRDAERKQVLVFFSIEESRESGPAGKIKMNHFISFRQIENRYGQGKREIDCDRFTEWKRIVKRSETHLATNAKEERSTERTNDNGGQADIEFRREERGICGMSDEMRDAIRRHIERNVYNIHCICSNSADFDLRTKENDATDKKRSSWTRKEKEMRFSNKANQTQVVLLSSSRSASAGSARLAHN